MLAHKLFACKDHTLAILKFPPHDLASSNSLIKVSAIQQSIKRFRFAIMYNLIELFNKYSYYLLSNILRAL